MTVDPLRDRFNEAVRRQLTELRIDPDAVFEGQRPARGRFAGWRFRPPVWTLWVAFTATMVLVVAGLTGMLLMLPARQNQPEARSAGSPSQAQSAFEPGVPPVSLGSLTIRTTALSYQVWSMRRGVVVLHLDLQNTGRTQAILSAGDMLLVNSNGGVFAPSWRDVDGASHDGLAESSHTLLGLEPGAEERMDVPFVVLGDGPFLWRVQRDGLQVDTHLPALTPAPSSS